MIINASQGTDKPKRSFDTQNATMFEDVTEGEAYDMRRKAWLDRNSPKGATLGKDEGMALLLMCANAIGPLPKRSRRYSLATRSEFRRERLFYCRVFSDVLGADGEPVPQESFWVLQWYDKRNPDGFFNVVSEERAHNWLRKCEYPVVEDPIFWSLFPTRYAKELGYLRKMIANAEGVVIKPPSLVKAR